MLSQLLHIFNFTPIYGWRLNWICQAIAILELFKANKFAGISTLGMINMAKPDRIYFDFSDILLDQL